MALAGTHKNASPKGACNRTKQEASWRQLANLKKVARPELLFLLDEILFAPTSYPLMAMCCSIPFHRWPNNLCMIDLKMKLYLELSEPLNCPKYLYGKTINVFGMHTFCCVGVSKQAMYNRIRVNTTQWKP